MQSLIAEISAILDAGHLSVGYASKISRKLSFAGSAMTGRVGRADLHTLYKYAASGGHVFRNLMSKLTQQLTQALE